jgi:hypothetical protein
VNDLWFIARYEAFGEMTGSERQAWIRRGGIEDWPHLRGKKGPMICRIEKSCNKKDLKLIAVQLGNERR